MTTQTKKSQYLLILRQPPGGAPPPEQLKTIMAEFQAWMQSLAAKHEVLGTNGLVPTVGKVLRGPNLTEIDGPYVETKEIIGGYVLIAADSFEDAVAAARQCPGLKHPMSVEVRPVIPRG